MNHSSWNIAFRIVPLALVVAACSDVTAPTSFDALDLAFAKGGNGGGGASWTAVEPDRLQHVRWYESEGTARQCQLNSFEDLDGNDRSRISSDGATEQVRVNEHDAFVLIREAVAPELADVPGHKHETDPGTGELTTRWVVTGVGRASWSQTHWQSAVDGSLISINMRAAGVVAPLSGADAVSVAQAILDYVAPDTPQSLNVKLADDLANVPLGPGDVPLDLIAAALAEADDAGTLQGVDCEWEQGIKSFILNEVEYVRNWPKQLAKLF